MPDVAIIVPCFNDGEFIENMLDSVVTDLDVEIVIIDDGSTDTETASALDAVRESGRARVVRTPNGGPGAARMTGLACTTAPYVLPLDADDELAEGGLEALHRTLVRDESLAFAFGDYEAFGTTWGRWKTPPWNPWALTYGNWWPVTSLFRREALERTGGWQLHGYEDWDLWLSLAEHGERGEHCGAIVYRRRLHGERVNTEARRRHAERYRLLRQRHPALWSRRSELRRSMRPSVLQRIAFPLVLGDRRLLPIWLENALIARRLRTGSRRLS